MTLTNPQVVIREVSGNPVGAARQWAWLMRVMQAVPNPTPTAPPARQEQPAASRAG